MAQSSSSPFQSVTVVETRALSAQCLGLFKSQSITSG